MTMFLVFRVCRKGGKSVTVTYHKMKKFKISENKLNKNNSKKIQLYFFCVCVHVTKNLKNFKL